jgi:hypothetical protein
MSVKAKLFQRATGSFRFPATFAPRAEKAAHALSRVAGRPDDDAYTIARSAIADMYPHRREGLTYSGTGRAASVQRPALHIVHGLKRKDDGVDNGHGGNSNVTLDAGAPVKLEGHGDATWGVIKHGKVEDTYGVLVTKGGAAIASKCKTLGFIADTSMSAECGATVKMTDIIEYERAIEAALGNDVTTPTLCTTDNMPNQLVAEGESSAARSRHHLRRYSVVQQRIAHGQVVLRHVPDTENPADFLTKWVQRAKFEKSIEYATNASEAVEETPAELRSQAKAKILEQFAVIAKKADHAAIEGKVTFVLTLDDD